MIQMIVFLVSSLLLLGCAGGPKPVPVAESPTPSPMALPESVIVPPAPAMNWLVASEPLANISPKVAYSALQQASQGSIIRPSNGDFRKASVRYRYRPGLIWAIVTEARSPTHLSFAVGSGGVEYNGLDDWWEVQTMRGGTPPEEEVHFIITPKAPGLQSNMTVVTDKGVYLLAIESRSARGMRSVSWVHEAPAILKAEVPTGTYHAGYQRLAVGRVPVWTPLAIWDTGNDGRTLILFPRERQTYEAPLLYIVVGTEKHLVNYDVKGDWLVVHRRFEEAELRLGHDENAEVILIRHGPSYRPITCPGDAACPPGGWS